LEEAVDLSSDRLLMMRMMMFQKLKWEGFFSFNLKIEVELAFAVSYAVKN
jgi:hypothetical protein